MPTGTTLTSGTRPSLMAWWTHASHCPPWPPDAQMPTLTAAPSRNSSPINCGVEQKRRNYGYKCLWENRNAGQFYEEEEIWIRKNELQYLQNQSNKNLTKSLYVWSKHLCVRGDIKCSTAREKLASWHFYRIKWYFSHAWTKHYDNSVIIYSPSRPSKPIRPKMGKKAPQKWLMWLMHYSK